MTAKETNRERHIRIARDLLTTLAGRTYEQTADYDADFYDLLLDLLASESKRADEGPVETHDALLRGARDFLEIAEFKDSENAVSALDVRERIDIALGDWNTKQEDRQCPTK